jgi:hypothetical protein
MQLSQFLSKLATPQLTDELSQQRFFELLVLPDYAERLGLGTGDASPVCLPHGRAPMSVNIACLAQQREHGRNSNEDWPETKYAELRFVVECMGTI